MGYNTDFSGQINIDPPLNTQEIEYLQKFSDTRRMQRTNGDYYVDGTGMCGQGLDGDITEYNSPPAGQPSLWCNFLSNDNGTALVWNDGEKTYGGAEWIEYIITHFLKPDAKARKELPFFRHHICNGEIIAQGEDIDDRYRINVINNHVNVENAEW